MKNLDLQEQDRLVTVGPLNVDASGLGGHPAGQQAVLYFNSVWYAHPLLQALYMGVKEANLDCIAPDVQMRTQVWGPGAFPSATR